MSITTPKARCSARLCLILVVSGWLGLLPARAAEKDFHDQRLVDANFNNQVLNGANFSGAILDRAYFQQASLKKANFQGASLNFVRWYRANLSDANLAGATGKLNFGPAILNGANFESPEVGKIEVSLGSEVEARGANFRKCILNVGIGSDLMGADVRGAVVKEAATDRVRWKNVIYDDDTEWPGGFDPQAAGCVKGKAEEKPTAPAAPQPPAKQTQTQTPPPPAAKGQAAAKGLAAEQDIPELKNKTGIPGPVADGVYTMMKISGGSLMGLGHLEIRGKTYQLVDEGGFKPFTIDQAGDITWSAGLNILPEGWKHVRSIYNKDEHGRPLIQIYYMSPRQALEVIDALKEG